MKIGIVDSGVGRDFLRQHPLTLGGAASFTLDPAAGLLETRIYDREDLLAWQHGMLEADIGDDHGHGTAVLSILYDQARPGAEVEFYLAKILDRDMKGYSFCLVEALEWLVEVVAPDFINLSLGTTQAVPATRLKELAEQAARRGMTLVCAAGGNPTLPAQLDGVIAVADGGLARSAAAGIKIDHVVAEPSVRVHAGGQWVEHPMTTSYACAVAVAAAMRGVRLGTRRRGDGVQ